MTQQIAEAVEEVLNARGVVVRVGGTHLCMAMRGVEQQESSTVTFSFKGELKERREEVLIMLNTP